ncbi:uncharacterized protein LOC125450600 [Stegostoma tigrinum]|uniref:uncharacterized protein LOC125450600 n=1 Tax=Stegostoma tigrinum TaxID=3053191 RepID=UPI0028707340|nr:uncharacterized protein LOC125450600 [Stegostoma tigrinum]XP_059499125.1 uncharacterized protein LOC125450600 [Stegostoma tigrinum]
MDLYILGMIVGGPAMRSGKIRIGDQLVEINGEPTMGMSHSRAVELIRHGHDRIRLLMRCGNGQVPEFGPDAVRRPDLGEATVVPVRQENPARAPRAQAELGATQGLARPRPHHPRALLAPGPGHPTTRQGRPPGGQSQAADARPVAGSARGHRRNQQGDGSGPETNLRPRSRALRDHSRQQSAPGSRSDNILEPTQSHAPLDLPKPGEFKAQLPSVDSRPQALLDSRPQALLDSRPQAVLDSRPQVLLDSRPQVLLDSRPQALLDSRPQALLDSRPQALLDSRPQALLDSRPQALLDSRPQALLDSRPQALLDSRPQALLDSRPQALLDSSPSAPVEPRFRSLPRDSRPRALLDSRPDAPVESRAQTLPSYCRPQAVGNGRALSEESTETDSDSWEEEEEDTASSSPELPVLGSFDEQRQLSSMIGRGLYLSSGPLLPAPGTADSEDSVHCGSQMGTKDSKRGRLRGQLSPGPWLVPEGEKLLGILGR